MVDLIGVGDAGIDVYIDVPELAGDDAKVVGVLTDTAVGGMVAHFCSVAARLGVRTGIAAVTGDDPFGVLVRDDLIGAGVEVSQLVQRPGANTFLSFVQLAPDRRRALVVARTGATYPEPGELDSRALQTARLVHVTAGDFALASWACTIAHAAGVAVSLDLDTAETRAGVDREQMLSLVASANIVVVNERGAEALFPDIDPAGATTALSAHGPTWSIVTLGSRGAVGFDGATHTWMAAVPAQVVDTTGAGDSFAASVAVSWLRQTPLADALANAVLVASESTTVLGHG